MPITQSMVVSGTTYYKADEPGIWGFTSNTALRSFIPPRGDSLSIAVVYTFGSGTATGCIFLWSDHDTSVDDDDDVIRPDCIAANAAGRWIGATSCWQGG